MPDSAFSAEAARVIDAATAAKLTPSPPDWRDGWIYFLMLDRFNNTDRAISHEPFDDPGYADFQGGTFAGVQAQLPYLKELGAGAIWLSPVLKNLPFERSYHGYGIHDFLAAEPRFARDPLRADDELRALVDAAHALGLYVIFDVVLNHAGDAFAYAAGVPDGFSPLPQPVWWRDASGAALPSFAEVENVPNPSRAAFVWPRELQKNAFFRRQGQMQGEDTFGDFSSLKQMRTEDPALQHVLIRAYHYVMSRFDVDGFRIDTLRYLKGDLPRLFGNSMREFALAAGKENFFTFGEVFDRQSEDDIARFIGRTTSDASDLVGVDAALDYPLFEALKPVVKGFAPPSVVADMYHRRKGVEANVLSSHGDATRFFVTFLDNHDVKERLRYVDPADPGRFDDQVTLGLACLLSLPGIPCIYYGTEQGLHGHGSDEAVREALWGGPGFDRAHPFYRELAKLSRLRAARPALRYGRFYFRPISGDGETFGISAFPQGVLAFSRILDDEELVIVANTSPRQPATVHVIVDGTLHADGAAFAAVYRNKPGDAPQAVARSAAQVTVHEVDGSLGTGPVLAVPVTLEPLEIQILAR